MPASASIRTVCRTATRRRQTAAARPGSRGPVNRRTATARRYGRSRKRHPARRHPRLPPHQAETRSTQAFQLCLARHPAAAAQLRPYSHARAAFCVMQSRMRIRVMLDRRDCCTFQMPVRCPGRRAEGQPASKTEERQTMSGHKETRSKAGKAGKRPLAFDIDNPKLAARDRRSGRWRRAATPTRRSSRARRTRARSCRPAAGAV